MNLKSSKENQPIPYKGTPIRLTADLSTETLQAKREWQDILKVIKQKKLQPRLFYTAKISFRFERNQKFYRQAKVKQIQHHKTSLTTNAKRTSLDRKQKFCKNEPKTI